MTNGILIYYHCGSNTGYAIKTLERVFFAMALNVSKDINKIHIGYPNYGAGRPIYIPDNFNNLVEIETGSSQKADQYRMFEYITKNRIDIAFGFDQPVTAPTYKAMRRAGVKLLISYYGSPISSINKGAKLLIKRLEVILRRNKPDHYIFESNACANTAIYGRGIRPANISVVSLGVNTEKFKLDSSCEFYAHRKFSIPFERKIVVYSGHMEERKGVNVIIHAANELVLQRKRKDVHFLFLGNRNAEELKFTPLYKDKESAAFITFGGYVDDIQFIFPSCYIGVIASTGWDSFTMSSLEMAASGLPLLVSDLQGLRETIDPEKTGFLFNPGESSLLASKIEILLNDPSKQKKMGFAGNERIRKNFSEKNQIEHLSNLVNELYGKRC